MSVWLNFANRLPVRVRTIYFYREYVVRTLPGMWVQNKHAHRVYVTEQQESESECESVR